MSNADRLSVQNGLILFGICVFIFILNIDYTAVNLAMIPIGKEISADLNHLQWLLSGYVLVWGALVIPAGRGADLYGKRKALIYGLSFFILGSLLCGAGQSLEVLILGRVLQGIGGAVYAPACYAQIYASMPPARQGWALGIVGSASGLGLATGPTLAGLILDYMNWRWIFYVNIPLGLIVLAGFFFLLPKEKKPPVPQKIDVVGFSLLASGLALFIFTLNQFEVWGLQDPLLWVSFALSILLLTCFFMWDRKQDVPTLPPSLLKNIQFRSTIASIFLISYNFSMILILVGLYLQGVKRFSNAETGLIFLSMTLVIAVLSPYGGKLTDRLDARLPIVGGSLSIAMAVVILAQLWVGSPLWMVITGLILAGIGLGLTFPSINTALLRTVESKEISTASGVFTMGMMIGNSLGVIMATSLLVFIGEGKLHKLLDNQAITLTKEKMTALSQILSKADHSALQFTAFPQNLVPQLMDIIDHAFVAGFCPNMLIGGGLALISALCIWLKLGQLKPAATNGEHSSAVPPHSMH